MSDGASAPTERLYYTDAYRAEFSARVIERGDDGRRVYLDRTAFYPTSGGQLHDLGSLGGIPVVDVIDEGDRIAHIISQPLPVADSVTGTIDWTRRFDHMQQHTGQHLLSAVFEDLLGARTVSVHFGDTHSTLDLDIDGLAPEKLRTVERRANEIVAENRAVTVTFEDAETATGLRKSVDRAGTLRIVSIDTLDRSACGGTHVRATGEIGCVMLRGVERIRKTMRIEFVCGLRAIERARADHAVLYTIASSLSAAVADLPSLIASQASRLRDLEQVNRGLEQELAQSRVSAMYADALKTGPQMGGAFQLRAKGSMDQIQAMSQAALKQSRMVLVAVDSEETRILVAASEDSGVDAARVLREALAAVGGKGGGSPRLAQGAVSSREAMTNAARLIDAALERGQLPRPPARPQV